MILIRQKNAVIQDFESCEHKDYKRNLNAWWQHEISQAWKAKWVVFKIQGFVCNRVLPSFPSPFLSPLFFHALILCPWTPWKRLLHRLGLNWSFGWLVSWQSKTLLRKLEKNVHKHLYSTPTLKSQRPSTCKKFWKTAQVRLVWRTSVNTSCVF